MPKNWIFQEGWTKYENGKTFPVDFPEEDVLFFDIENCVAEGPWPTLATAVSSKGQIFSHILILDKSKNVMNLWTN